MTPDKIVFALVLILVAVAAFTALLVTQRRSRPDRQTMLALAVLAAVIIVPSVFITVFWSKGVLSGAKIFASIVAAVFGWLMGMGFAESPSRMTSQVQSAK
jgi:Na+/proline symporter